MDWYYAVGEDRKGPLNEEEFQSLVRQGVITAQTLVWREGMANWQPHGSSAPAPVLENAPAGGVICTNCGRTFPGGDVIPLAGGLYCATCKPVALQRLREGDSAASAVEEMRNAHLKHEASVKSIGVLYYIGGAGAALVGVATLISSVSSSGSADTIFAVFLAIGMLVLGAGQVWVGTGLRRLKRWARIPVGILSGIGLIGFPLGTIINAYILYLVFGKKGVTVFSDEYRLVIEQTPHIKYKTSIVVWIFLGLVLLLIVAGLVAAIVGGFR
jgi:hypothetical protein